jgi:outer membrane protein OmpA-like peptidoglycan-associated protein
VSRRIRWGCVATCTHGASISTSIVAAAIGSGIALFSAVKFAAGGVTTEWSRVLGAVLMTLVVIMACLLARAYSVLQWQFDLIKRNLTTAEGGTFYYTADAPLTLTMTMEGAAKAVKGLEAVWPKRETVQYVCALSLGFLATGLFLWYIWLPAPQPVKPPPPSPIGIEPVLGLVGVVYFGPNQSNISEASIAIVRNVARRFSADRTLCLRIEAHTDQDATNAYNLTLSRLRAETVRAIAQSEGISAARVTSFGYGKTRLTSSSTGPSDKAENRRAEILLERCR